MTPSEFDSYAIGFELTSARYSGGAGGTFASLITGQPNWTVDGATPAFETRSGLEGMVFTNAASQSVLGEMRALYEATVVCVAAVDTNDNMFTFGGNDLVTTRFGQQFSTKSMQTFTSALPSGAASGGGNSNVHVWASSWSPSNGTVYAQVNDGAVTSASNASDKRLAAVDYPNAAIGRGNRSSTVLYFAGWIHRVYVFNRALHFRDNASLQALITAEIARIS